MSMFNRKAMLGAALTAGLAVVIAVYLLSATGADTWQGGLVAPSPIQVPINPHMPPAGSAIATGIVVTGSEMIIYLSYGEPGDRSKPMLVTMWRDVQSGHVRNWLPMVKGVEAVDVPDNMWALRQELAPDGTLVEYGVVNGPAERIVITDGDRSVDARFARWTADPAVTIFWVQRTGTPIPDNVPVCDGRYVHWMRIDIRWYRYMTATAPRS